MMKKNPLIFTALIAVLVATLLAIAAARSRSGSRGKESFLSVIHTYSESTPSPLLLSSPSVDMPQVLSKWDHRRRAGTMSIKMGADRLVGRPHIALGDAVDLVGKEYDMVLPLMGRESRRHLLMYALMPEGGSSGSKGRVTLAELISSGRKIRFVVPDSKERKDRYTALIDAAWKTAVAPRGIRRSFTDSPHQASLSFTGRSHGTIIPGDSADSPVHVCVVWANAVDARSKTPGEIVAPYFAYPADGGEAALGNGVANTYAPRFVTYYDADVADTSKAMQTVAPFLRPDRVMLRDSDDAIRIATLAYSPDVLLVHREAAMHADHVEILDSVTRDAFAASDDPARLAAECAYLQETTGIRMRPALLQAARRYFGGEEKGDVLEFKPVVLNHHRGAAAAEGFTAASESAAAAAAAAVDLVPMHALNVAGMSYPKEFRDSVRSVRHLQLADAVVDGVTLRVNDRVELHHQADARENGRYVVVSAERGNGVGPILQSPRVLRGVRVIKKGLEPTDDKGVPGTRWRLVGSSGGNGVRVGDAVLWITPEGDRYHAEIDAVSSTKIEAVMSTEKPLSDWLHPLSRCSSDPDGIPTMQLCVSEWDVADSAKVGPSVARAQWDRPCEHDLDCPFYDEKTRGYGCQGGGSCAMPVGVRRVGHRGYDRVPTLKKNIP